MNTRHLGAGYQGAVEATLALVISVLIGVWADTKLDTSPAFLFTGLAVGFGAFILRLTRLLREVGEPEADKSGDPPQPDQSDRSDRSQEDGSRDRSGETAREPLETDRDRDSDC